MLHEQKEVVANILTIPKMCEMPPVCVHCTLVVCIADCIWCVGDYGQGVCERYIVHVV